MFPGRVLVNDSVDPAAVVMVCRTTETQKYCSTPVKVTYDAKVDVVRIL